MIQWIVSSSVLILAVALLRAVFGKRLKPGLRYALWGLVLLRLLIPGTVFQSSYSVASAVETVREQPSAALAEAVTDSPLPRMSWSDADRQLREQYARQGVDVGEFDLSRYEHYTYEVDAYRRGDFTVKDALRWVWIAGAAVTAAVFLVQNLCLLRRLRRGRVRIGAEGTLPVWAVEGLRSSCLFLRGIYVSDETAGNGAELRHVLAHELSHRRHGDHVWALLRCCAIALHWWNPLVWWAAGLSRQDGELFADAGALTRLGEEERASYGDTLIRLSTAYAPRVSLLSTATTMNGGKRDLKERISMIVKQKRTAPVLAALVLLLAAAVVVLAVTGASKEKTNQPAGTPAPGERVFTPTEATITELFSGETATLSVRDGGEADIHSMYAIYQSLPGTGETVNFDTDTYAYIVTLTDGELDLTHAFRFSKSLLYTLDGGTEFYFADETAFETTYERLALIWRTWRHTVPATDSDLTPDDGSAHVVPADPTPSPAPTVSPLTGRDDGFYPVSVSVVNIVSSYYDPFFYSDSATVEELWALYQSFRIGDSTDVDAATLRNSVPLSVSFTGADGSEANFMLWGPYFGTTVQHSADEVEIRYRALENGDAIYQRFYEAVGRWEAVWTPPAAGDYAADRLVFVSGMSSAIPTARGVRVRLDGTAGDGSLALERNGRVRHYTDFSWSFMLIGRERFEQLFPGAIGTDSLYSMPDFGAFSAVRLCEVSERDGVYLIDVDGALWLKDNMVVYDLLPEQFLYADVLGFNEALEEVVGLYESGTLPQHPVECLSMLSVASFLRRQSWELFDEAQFNALSEALRLAAVGEDQQMRDLNMMLTAQTTDGAFAEPFYDPGGYLHTQYLADPEVFEAVLAEQSEAFQKTMEHTMEWW